MPFINIVEMGALDSNLFAWATSILGQRGFQVSSIEEWKDGNLLLHMWEIIAKEETKGLIEGHHFAMDGATFGRLAVETIPIKVSYNDENLTESKIQEMLQGIAYFAIVKYSGLHWKDVTNKTIFELSMLLNVRLTARVGKEIGSITSIRALLENNFALLFQWIDILATKHGEDMSHHKEKVSSLQSCLDIASSFGISSFIVEKEKISDITLMLLVSLFYQRFDSSPPSTTTKLCNMMNKAFAETQEKLSNSTENERRCLLEAQHSFLNQASLWNDNTTSCTNDDSDNSKDVSKEDENLTEAFEVLLESEKELKAKNIILEEKLTEVETDELMALEIENTILQEQISSLTSRLNLAEAREKEVELLAKQMNTLMEDMEGLKTDSTLVDPVTPVKELNVVAIPPLKRQGSFHNINSTNEGKSDQFGLRLQIEQLEQSKVEMQDNIEESISKYKILQKEFAVFKEVQKEEVKNLKKLLESSFVCDPNEELPIAKQNSLPSLLAIHTRLQNLDANNKLHQCSWRQIGCVLQAKMEIKDPTRSNNLFKKSNW